MHEQETFISKNN